MGLPATIYGEELDGKANGTQRFDLVIDLGRDGLNRAGLDFDVDRRAGGDEAKPTVVNDDPSPGSGRDSVSPTQPGWHGVLVPDRRNAYRPQTFGHLRPPAQWTIQRRPEPSCPIFGVENPCTQLEGRPVADMLVVPAFQFGDPVAQLVLVIAGDQALHAQNLVDPRDNNTDVISWGDATSSTETSSR